MYSDLDDLSQLPFTTIKLRKKCHAELSHLKFGFCKECFSSHKTKESESPNSANSQSVYLLVKAILSKHIPL